MDPSEGAPPPNRRMSALGDLHVLSDENLCEMISRLAAKEVMNLACVSSVLYIFCMEEPLWMTLCARDCEGMLRYEGSWRQTLISRIARGKGMEPPTLKPVLQFQGFSSMFLYRRWYRCHVKLGTFAADNGAVERRAGLTKDQFVAEYDGKKPVMLTDVTEDWAPLSTWTRERLLENYGDVAFKVSQYHGKKSQMTLRDYFAYMDVQCDEEPLYIFDEKFGESAPSMLECYKVPQYFQEDFLTLLGEKRRPSYRWFLVGPARSGASWHVDPALTAAWNTLLRGRKRWALYPPGRVPPAVTVHVDEDTGEVNYDGPTSLQWWMDVYPNLHPDDKPLECTQVPGETISVPTGWWHCVLNLEETVAVTQNFVNARNLEVVLLDMTPGYRHRGIARAGSLAIREEAKRLAAEGKARAAGGAWKARATTNGSEHAPAQNKSTLEAGVDNLMPTHTEQGLKRRRSFRDGKGGGDETGLAAGGDADSEGVGASLARDGEGVEWERMEREEYLGEGWLSLIARVIAEDQVEVAHFVEKMGENGYMRAKDTRRWIRTLWLSRPELIPRLWKCACIMFAADKWLDRVNCICCAHGLRTPDGIEQLPVGGGTNPVYVIGDAVIKVYVNGDSERTPVDCITRELELYSLMLSTNSSLCGIVPPLIGNGMLVASPSADDRQEYRALPSDMPTLVTHPSSSQAMPEHVARELPRQGLWNGALGRNGLPKSPGVMPYEEGTWPAKAQDAELEQWPYLITKRCDGKELGRLEREATEEDVERVTGFVSDALRYLHSVPLPESCGSGVAGPALATNRAAPNGASANTKGLANGEGKANGEAAKDGGFPVPPEWQLFVQKLRRQRHEASDRLQAWESVPEALLSQIDTYLPEDPAVLAGLFPGCDSDEHARTATPRPVWLHTDIHDDNILCAYVPRGSPPLDASGSVPATAQTLGGSTTAAVGLTPEGGSGDAAVQVRVQARAAGAGEGGGAEGRGTCERENGGEVCERTSSSRPANGPPQGNDASDVELQLRYLLDFGDVLLGDALYDLVAMHVGIFRGKSTLLASFTERYARPLHLPPPALALAAQHLSFAPKENTPAHVPEGSAPPKGPPTEGNGPSSLSTGNHTQDRDGVTNHGADASRRLERVSYRALCYCLLHEQDFIGLLFSKMKDLRTLGTLEEVEIAVWGPLNGV